MTLTARTLLNPATLLGFVLENRALISDLLFDIVQRIPAVTKLPGIYEVIDFHAELELHDAKGRSATYRKTQNVCFLQDNIIAYQDTAWGDGEIFASYQCSPGLEVDRYREGNRYHVLISLRETKNRDDQEVIRIERGIRDGFINAVEEFQVDIDHGTRQLSLRLILPRERSAKQVTLIEQNARRSTRLGSEKFECLPDGRHIIVWETDRPRTYETYILRWEW